MNPVPYTKRNTLSTVNCDSTLWMKINMQWGKKQYNTKTAHFRT